MDAFGLRDYERRSEISAGAAPGRKAGTDRSLTVDTTVTEGIPEGFHPATSELLAAPSKLARSLFRDGG